jgi:HD-GYP domain-containing protein (c-di-GMP phosphodiesterase class II)
MRLFKSTRLMYQLLFIFLLIGLLPLLVSTSHLVALTQTELQYKIKGSHTDRSLDTSRALEREMQAVFDELLSLGEALRRTHSLSESSGSELGRVLLDSFTAQPGAFDQLAIRTLKDDLYVSSRAGESPSRNFRGFLLNDALLARVSEGRVFFGELFNHEDSGTLKLSVAVPLLVEAGPLGALFAEVSLERLRELIDTKNFGDEGVTYAVDRDGRCFAYSGSSAGRELRSFADREGVQQVLQRTAQGATHHFDEQGRDILVAYSPVQNPRVAGIDVPLNWGVVIEEPAEHTYTLVARMTRDSLSYVLMAALLAILATSLAAFRISRPLRLLTEGARRFGQGMLETRIEVGSSNEIGELARTFNHMAGSIRSYTDQLKAKAEEMRELFLESIAALAEAIDAKDPYTRGHAQRVANYSVLIAQEMDLDEAKREEIYIAALLHDVGKVGIPDAILNKPGPLSRAEYEIMKQHPVLGAKIMCPIKKLENVIPGMLQHHELWDGSGYPEGIKGEDISLSARIIGVADTFDAMTTDRPYQKKLRDDIAINTIRGLRNKRYDPEVVQAFFRAYPKFEKPDKVNIYEVLGHEEAVRSGLAA